MNSQLMVVGHKYRAPTSTEKQGGPQHPGYCSRSSVESWSPIASVSLPQLPNPIAITAAPIYARQASYNPVMPRAVVKATVKTTAKADSAEWPVVYGHVHLNRLMQQLHGMLLSGNCDPRPYYLQILRYTRTTTTGIPADYRRFILSLGERVNRASALYQSVLLGKIEKMVHADDINWSWLLGAFSSLQAPAPELIERYSKVMMLTFVVLARSVSRSQAFDRHKADQLYRRLSVLYQLLPESDIREDEMALRGRELRAWQDKLTLTELGQEIEKLLGEQVQPRFREALRLLERSPLRRSRITAEVMAFNKLRTRLQADYYQTKKIQRLQRQLLCSGAKNQAENLIGLFSAAPGAQHSACVDTAFAKALQVTGGALQRGALVSLPFIGLGLKTIEKMAAVVKFYVEAHDNVHITLLYKQLLAAREQLQKLAEPDPLKQES